jgi:signal transduction histidine kinase
LSALKAHLSNFFLPPYFADEERRRRADSLNVILWAGLGLTIVYLLATLVLPTSAYFNIIFELLIITLHIICLLILRRGHTRIASWVYCIVLWIIVSYATLGIGEITSTGVSSLYTVILIAGVLLGPLGGFGLAALSVAAVSLIAVRLHLEFGGEEDWLPAITVSTNFALIAIIAWLGQRSILTSISREATASSKLSQRSAQLQAAADIGMAASSSSNLDELLETSTRVIAERFGLYHVSILVLDQTTKELTLRPVSQGGKKADSLVAIRPTTQADKSIIAHVARTKRPYLAIDVSSEPLYLHNPQFPETRSEIAVPLMTGSKLFGVLDVLSNDASQLGTDEQRALQVLANQLGTAIHNLRLLLDASRHLEELQALHAIVTAGMETSDENEFLRRATEVVGKSLFPTNFGVLLLDERQNVLHHHVSYQESNSRNPRPIPVGQGITGLVALAGHSMRVDDVTTEPKYISLDPRVRSELCVPLKINSRVIGVLDVEGHKLAEFSQNDERLLEALAGQIGLSLERIRLLAGAQTRADELAKTVKQQEELSRLRDEFIQNVSHEFRTPLSIVSGYTEILDSGELGELPPAYKQPIGIIAKRVQMLTKLVDDLTSLLDLESHRKDFTDLRLSDVINPMYAGLRSKALTEQIQLDIEIDRGLPQIHGEETLLTRVVNSLVENAIKFTPPNGYVRVGLHAQNGSVCLTVADTGIGIPAEDQAQIFSRFYQVDGSSSRRYGGTGLGLAIVKEIVDLHGGTIVLTSEPNKGSTFEVRLPALPVRP